MRDTVARFAPLLLVASFLGPGCMGRNADSGEEPISLEGDKGDDARARRLREYEARLRGSTNPTREEVERDRNLPEMSAEDLMLIIEDDKAHRSTRARAAFELGQLKDPRYVDRLATLLPGKVDALSKNIIIALGEIGDPKALPALRKSRGAYEAQGDWAYWRIEGVLDDTISKLEGVQKRQEW